MKKFIFYASVFLFPLFFLSLTQDFFVFNKFYLLIAAVLLLLLTSAFSYLVSKKFSWVSKPFDLPILLFITSVGLSTVFSSTNKIQALYNLNFGPVMLILLGVIYFYLSRFWTSSPRGEAGQNDTKRIFSATGLVLSLVTIFFFFQPLKNIALPSAIDFLKNPLFTPMGGMLDLVVILGFFSVVGLTELITKKLFKVYSLVSVILPSIALLLAIYTIVKNNLLILPPFSNSWYAVLEIMKNIKTAFVGAGIDNFSSVFTKVKDLEYNQLPVWNINAFNISRITPLHIMTEAGLLGLLSFGFLIFTTFRVALNSFTLSGTKGWLLNFVYLLLVLLFFPPSLMIFFLLFITLGVIASKTKQSTKETDLSDLPIAYVGLTVLLLIIVVGSGYFAGRLYASEYYFKKSIDALIKQDAKGVYDNMRVARSLNPYNERFVLNFSQTNLLIADSIARKEIVNEQDRQTIAQAVQAAISEAKELVRLNPNKSQNFENLANVYQNIIPIAQGSEAWAISSYQRAIALDPANPALRLNLGGIYYLLGRYDDATNFFEQAVSLKPDWPNAHYNLAWSYYQNGQYDRATAAMENVTKLINKDVAPEDFQKASQELESFKKELNLPEEPAATLEPKLELPPESSPEAR